MSRRSRSGPGDRHLPVFHGLAKDLEDILPELGRLIQEKHAVVGKAHLPRLGYLAAADQAGIGDGMVRRAKRADRDEGPLPHESHDTVNLRRLQRLLEGEIGKDRGESLGQHGLARAGRPHHENVVNSLAPLPPNSFRRRAKRSVSLYLAEVRLAEVRPHLWVSPPSRHSRPPRSRGALPSARDSQLLSTSGLGMPTVTRNRGYQEPTDCAREHFREVRREDFPRFGLFGARVEYALLFLVSGGKPTWEATEEGQPRKLALPTKGRKGSQEA